MTLALATGNKHKKEEMRHFLREYRVQAFALDELRNIPAIVEDGATFTENALKKARIIFQSTGMVTLADDSGLEVFYLADRPGVISARYAGEPCDDAKNNEKLLAEMRGVAPRRRRAQFRCVLALVGPGFEETAEGTCKGVLGTEPHGTNGFGYDPIFIPDGFSRTYAQLTFEEKAQISHRANAFKAMHEIFLRRLQ